MHNFGENAFVFKISQILMCIFETTKIKIENNVFDFLLVFVCFFSEINCCINTKTFIIKRNNDSFSCHQVCGKKIHINRYLHANSHHYLAQKLDMINTLVNRAFRLFNKEHLEEEIYHLSKVFKRNGYKDRQIKCIVQKVGRGPQRRQNTKDEMGKITLPCIKGTIDKISRILRKRKISVVFSPKRIVRKTLD